MDGNSRFWWNAKATRAESVRLEDVFRFFGVATGGQQEHDRDRRHRNDQRGDDLGERDETFFEHERAPSYPVPRPRQVTV